MNYRRFNKITKKKPKRKKWFFFFSFFLLTIYFLFFSKFFNLKNIIITGNNKIKRNDIVSEVQKEINNKKLNIINNNILLMDVGEIRKNVLSISPVISDVRIDRKFPNSLKVFINERIGSAIFCSIEKKCFVVDKDGFSFEKYSEENKDLPVIIGNNPQDFFLGNKLIKKELLSTILSFYSKVKNSDILLKKLVIISDKRINAVTENGWEIYFNPKENTEWQITKLNSVLSEIPSEKKDQLKYIELRFGNMVPFKLK